MTLEAAFKDLTAKWERLAEELEQGLLWSVTETNPAEEHALATHYVDAATDLIAAAREGLAACRAAVDGGLSLGQAGQSLLLCQARYNALIELFYSQMASYGRLRRLRRFGREKGGAWRDWAAHVRKATGPLPPAHGRSQSGAVRLLAGGGRPRRDRHRVSASHERRSADHNAAGPKCDRFHDLKSGSAGRRAGRPRSRSAPRRRPACRTRSRILPAIRGDPNVDKRMFRAGECR